MTRILSGDLLIADVLVPMTGSPAIEALIEKYQMQPGAKMALNDEQLKEFKAALDGVEHTVMPGGSSANMLTTLCKILGKEIEVRFLGMAGDAKYCSIIRDSLIEAGITLVPERFPGGHVLMQSAVSFVFVYPDGQCTTATNPGNAREILKPAMIAEHLVKNSEIVFVQGSLWHKFQTDFADRLVKLCSKHQRQLWLTLPTQAKPSGEEIDHFLKVLPDAHLVFGNHAELERLYGASLDEGLNKLQKAFRDRERVQEDKKSVGFITFGKDGAAVVTTQNIEFVQPIKIKGKEIVNTIGAGDTAYAAFAAGHLKQLPEMTSAQLAMALAGEKLRTNAPRLSDPKATLSAAAPDLARMLKTD